MYACYVRGKTAVRVAIEHGGTRVGVFYGSRNIWERLILPGLKARAEVRVVDLTDKPKDARKRLRAADVA